MQNQYFVRFVNVYPPIVRMLVGGATKYPCQDLRASWRHMLDWLLSEAQHESYQQFPDQFLHQPLADPVTLLQLDSHLLILSHRQYHDSRHGHVDRVCQEDVLVFCDHVVQTIVSV